MWARYRFRSSTVKTRRVQCKFLCLYVVVNIANENKKLETPADIIPLYARKILNISVERKYPFFCVNIDIIVFSLNSAMTTLIFSKKLLRTTNYHYTKSCLVPIYIFCIIIILSFTMTVGILMLHCGLGIRNTNTFYTFRCPQSLEMIRLYYIDVKKTRSIFETIFFAQIFVLNPNNKTISFSVAENELNKLDFG